MLQRGCADSHCITVLIQDRTVAVRAVRCRAGSWLYKAEHLTRATGERFASCTTFGRRDCRLRCGKPISAATSLFVEVRRRQRRGTGAAATPLGTEHRSGDRLISLLRDGCNNSDINDNPEIDASGELPGHLLRNAHSGLQNRRAALPGTRREASRFRRSFRDI
jgi:hypothetical protein